MFSFLRNSSPVTVIEVAAVPADGANPNVAPPGRGAYTIAAGPVTFLELVAVTLNVKVMLSAMLEAIQLVGEIIWQVAAGLTFTV